MCSVAGRAIVGGLALALLIAGMASAQVHTPPDTLPPPPTQQFSAVSLANGYDYGAAAPQDPRRQTTAFRSSDDDDAPAVTALNDSDSSSQGTAASWFNRSTIKLKSVVQSMTRSSSPQTPNTSQNPLPPSQYGLGSPPGGYSIPGNLAPPMGAPATSCGSPCEQAIPYVPYSAAQAPFAAAFFPCPYYPPCYSYSGQLCATSPCLCPPPCNQPACGQPPCNQAMGGQMLPGQPANGQQPPTGQPTNGPTSGAPAASNSANFSQATANTMQPYGGSGPLSFADHNGERQENQLWVPFYRFAAADNSGGFVGGPVDYFFGSDMFFTMAARLDGPSNGNMPIMRAF